MAGSGSGSGSSNSTTKTQDSATTAAQNEIAAYKARGGQVGVTPVGSPVGGGSGGGGGGSGGSAPQPSQQPPSNVSHFSKLTPAEAERLGLQKVGEPAIGSQLYYKSRMLQDPNAQWSSRTDFMAAASQIAPYAKEGTVFRGAIPGRPEPAPSLSPSYYGGLSPSEVSRYTSGEMLPPANQHAPALPSPAAAPSGTYTKAPEIKFGNLWYNQNQNKPAIPKSNIELAAGPAKDSGIAVSDFSKRIQQWTANQGAKLRGFADSYEQASAESKSQGSLIRAAVPYLTRSTAGVIEFGGMVPATTEVIGKTAIKNPSALPGMALVGADEFLKGMIKQARENPIQLGSDLAISAGIFKGAGRLIPIKAGKVEMPVMEGETAGKTPIWRGIYSDIRSSKPVVGLGQTLESWKIKVGSIQEMKPGSYKPGILFPKYELQGTPEPIVEAIPKPNIIVGMPKAEQIPASTVESAKSAIKSQHEARTAYFPQTRIETAVMTQPDIMSKLGYSPLEQRKIGVGMQLIDITQNQRTAFQATKEASLLGIKYEKPVFIYETGMLPGAGVRETVKFAAEKRGNVHDIGGSFAQNPQLMEQYRRIPGDIDIHTALAEEDAVKLAGELQSRFTNIGIESKLEGSNIMIKNAAGNWKHAVQVLPKETIDILETGTPTANADLTYGFRTGKPTIDIENVPTTQLSEQGIRKAQGSLRWGAGEIKPVEGRMKDIADLYRAQKTLIESRAVRSGNVPDVVRGRALLEEWKSLWPEIDWGKELSKPTIDIGMSPKKAAGLGTIAAASLMMPSAAEPLGGDYFNKAKVDSSPAIRYSKNFGSESLVGSSKNILSASDYYQQLSKSIALSGADSGTYLPQWPYYDIKPYFPAGGSPGTSVSSPGKGYLEYPYNVWGGGGLKKQRLPYQEPARKTKSKRKEKFFFTERTSPILAPSTDLRGLRKAMGLSGGGGRKGKKGRRKK